MRAVQVSEFGGPEVLKVVELPKPVPAAGQLLVKVDRAGINYADTHQAENSYLSQQKLPSSVRPTISPPGTNGSDWSAR